MSTFVLSIETDAGTYQHAFHLGTDERIAREFAIEIFRHSCPARGRRIVTVALIRDRKIFDVFDGEWSSDRADLAFND